VSWLWSGLAALLLRGLPRRWGHGIELAQTFVPYSLRCSGSSNDLFQMTRLPSYPLSEIRQPALIIHGTADRVASFSNAELAASGIPQARLIRIPGAGHGVFFLRPDWLAPGVVEFLQAHAPAGLAAA
jgi:pimeloyl-ACP methyl ester carboxylesterase